jgi:hypothetical protein
VGVPAEEYDPSDRRQFGSFPQAFSHFALINTARGFGRIVVAPGGGATTPAAAEATPRR